MTLSFASRAAANKLALIIGLVLIPAIFFGGAFVRQAMHDISFLDREIQGVQLAELVFPAVESNSIEVVRSDLAKIREMEVSLGIAEVDGLEAHARRQKAQEISINMRPNLREAGQMHDYISDLASTSGVILDSDSESYHLANMLLINLPVVWNDAAKFERMYLDPTPQLTMRSKLSVITGNLEGAFQRQKDSLKRAMESSETPQGYSLILVSTEKLEENVNDLSSNMTSLQPAFNRTKIVGLTSGVRRLSHAIVNPSFSILKAKLELRKQNLNQVLWIVLATGLLTLIIASYLAARLISTTFKKLDAVEEAHRVSEVMRMEADRVNGEVADLNRSLADSLKKLQDAQSELLNKGKMEQLGQLTATVAHEIRNPLGSVRTSAFLIGRKIDTKKIGIDVQLDRINKGVDRCDSIITQLLDFSRTKQIIAQPSKFDDWLEMIIREDGESIPAPIAIECHLGLGELEVSFDQARLRRAIINLMQNSAEAMVGKDEGAPIQAGYQPRICVSTKKCAERIEIVVKDNGPGMSSDVMAKIREPLFTTKNFGTGLGVPAVEQIVNQHGGELLITSQPGQGAAFTICIPITHARSEAA